MLDIQKKLGIVELLKQERFSEMLENPKYLLAYQVTKQAVLEIQKQMKGRPPGFRTHVESLALNRMYEQTEERTAEHVSFVDIAFKHIRNETEKGNKK